MVRCVQTKCCLYIFWGGELPPKLPPCHCLQALMDGMSLATYGRFTDGAIWIRFDCLTCHSYSHKIGTTGKCTSSSTRCNKLSTSDRCCSIAVCETSPWLDVWLLRVLFGNCHKHWSHGHDTLAKKIPSAQVAGFVVQSDISADVVYQNISIMTVTKLRYYRHTDNSLANKNIPQKPFTYS